MKLMTILPMLLLCAVSAQAATTPETLAALQQSQIQTLIEQNKKLRADVDALKTSAAGSPLKIKDFSASWSYSTYPNEASSPWYRLPFSINAGGYGASYLLICSSNHSDGAATRSSIDLIRAGYSGNNYGIDHIGGSAAIYSHRATADGFLEVQTFGGNTNCAILSNRL